MKKEQGIFFDLYAPIDWTETAIVDALSVEEAVGEIEDELLLAQLTDADRLIVDVDEASDEMDEGLVTKGRRFNSEEIRYLAKCMTYYFGMPREEWGDDFDLDIPDTENPDPDDGRIIVSMVYPDHLEPPASLAI